MMSNEVLHNTWLSYFVFITEVIVVVLESFAGEAQRLLCEVCDVKIKIDFVSIPDGDYLGTADSLRLIKDKIKVVHVDYYH